MKSSMSSFGTFALSRSEMKNVMGGGCQVCSQGKKGSACGGIINASLASSLVNELNATNDGYFYFKACSPG